MLLVSYDYSEIYMHSEEHIYHVTLVALST